MTKVTDLTALTGAAGATTDLVNVVDVSDTTMAGTGTNKKMTMAELVIFLAANGLGVVGKYTVSIGDGSTINYVVTHNLNTLDVQVYVYENGGSKRMVLCEVQHTSVNTVTIGVYPAVASNALRVVVTG